MTSRFSTLLTVNNLVIFLLLTASVMAAEKQVLLGVNIREVGSLEANRFGVVSDNGGVIVKVFPGYAADKAGLRAGDVVVACGTHAISSCADLYKVIAASKSGDRYLLTIHRGPSSQRIAIVLGATTDGVRSAKQEIYLGVRLRSAGHPEAKAAGIESPLGAVVMHVTADAPAARAGLRQYDLIVEFAGHEIQVYEDLEAAARRCAFGSRQRVVFIRGFNRLQTEIVIGARPLTAATAIYKHPSEAFRLALPRGWTFSRPDLSQLSDERKYDLIQLNRRSVYVFCLPHCLGSAQRESDTG